MVLATFALASAAANPAREPGASAARQAIRWEPIKGIWRSDDAGQTWMEKTHGLTWKEPQGFAAGSDATKDLVMLYCTVRSKDEVSAFKGVFKSTGDGQTWQAFGDLPFSNIPRVEFDPLNDAPIHVTTFGGSVWRRPIAP